MKCNNMQKAPPVWRRLVRMKTKKSYSMEMALAGFSLA